MKILHIETGRHLYGGARQVAYLIDGLTQTGVENHLLAPLNSGIANLVRDRVAGVHEIDTSGDLDWRLATHTRGIALSQGIDIIHVHSRRGADFWGGIGAKLAGIPAVLSRRVDNPEPRAAISIKYPLYRRVITISDAIHQVLLDCGVAADKLVTVRSAVDPEDYRNPVSRDEFQRRFSLQDKVLTIAIVAQLIARKGHRYLFAAMRELSLQHPNLRLICFGSGPELANLETLASEYQLQQIISFAGFQEDLNRFIGHFDIVAHPALAEGLGVALIQASAAGVPIVGSRAGGIPEIVRHGENGFLVPPADEDALTKALESLLSDPALRKAMGAAGSRLVDEEFSTAAMVAGNLLVYRQVLKT